MHIQYQKACHTIFSFLKGGRECAVFKKMSRTSQNHITHANYRILNANCSMRGSNAKER
jgi:hypothetical protein